MVAIFTLSSSSSTFLCPSPRTKPSTTLTHFSSLPKTPTHLKKPVLDVTFLSSLLQCDLSILPAVQSFWQWLRDEGVVSTKSTAVAKPALVPEGIGLVAHKNIGKSEVVLEVPKRLAINPYVVSASEIGNVCSGLKLWVSTALFLLREKHRDESK